MLCAIHSLDPPFLCAAFFYFLQLGCQQFLLSPRSMNDFIFQQHFSLESFFFSILHGLCFLPIPKSIFLFYFPSLLLLIFFKKYLLFGRTACVILVPRPGIVNGFSGRAAS